MKARTFEDRVNAGHYTHPGGDLDFARDAKHWLRERIPPHVVNKLFSLAITGDMNIAEKLHALKSYVELFEPVKIVLAIDDRDERVYYAICDEAMPCGSTPETGWSYEEALGSLIKRSPERFGFLIEQKGRMHYEAKK